MDQKNASESEVILSVLKVNSDTKNLLFIDLFIPTTFIYPLS